MQRHPVRMWFAVVACLSISPSDGLRPAGEGDRFAERAILRASDAREFDQFGSAVAVSGDTVIVGAARRDQGLEGHAGAAYVFEPGGGGAAGWGELAMLVASDFQGGDEFGFAVAISGDTAIVGAYLEDGGASDLLDNAGAAYIFARNQGGTNAWGEVAKLTASDPQDNDRFGRTVAISGGTAIVGAYLENGGDGDPIAGAGAAYVFERNEGGNDAWGEVVKLTAADAQATDGFGFAVAISGDTVVVGAHVAGGGLGNPDTQAGAAYVFGRDEGGPDAWGQVVKLTAADSQAHDVFGRSVAISGDTVIVGAYVEDGGAGDPVANAGAAYVFGRDEGGLDAWGQVAKLTASDAQEDDFFGQSVAVSGNTAIVGANREDGGAGDPFFDAGGAAYVFGRDEGGADAWGEVMKLTASDAAVGDFFGWSVGISGSTSVVGAKFEDGGPGDLLNVSGAAYVFVEGFLQFFIGDVPGSRASRSVRESS